MGRYEHMRFVKADERVRVSRLLLVAMVLVMIATSCVVSADLFSTSPSAATVPTEALPTGELTETSSGSLSDFFQTEDLPAMPTTGGVDQTSGETTSTSSPTAVAGLMPTPANGSSLTETVSEGDGTTDGKQQVQVIPAFVPTFGDHRFEVSGTGYGAGVEVRVIACVIPGDPIIGSVSQDALAARLVGLDASIDCDLARSVAVTTDEQGRFVAGLTSSIEANSMVYAADTQAGAGAYVLVPRSR